MPYATASHALSFSRWITRIEQGLSSPGWSAAGAFFVYGGYSAWINGDNPHWIRLGLAHGTYAVCSTLGLYAVLAWLHGRLAPRRFGVPLSWLIATVFAVTLPAMVQSAAGSTVVLKAIAPGAVAGAIYSIVVLRKLSAAMTANARASSRFE